MATVQSLKKKLRTIRSTVKLTRAMKTASTVKFSKLNGIYSEYQNYADEYMHLYKKYCSQFNSAFACNNPDAPCCYVVLASNKGLCGNLNTELFNFFCSIEEKGIVVSCGKEATDYFEKKGIEINKSFTLNDVPEYEQVKEVFEYLCLLLREGKISSIKTVYSEYINMIKQKPVCKPLLTSVDCQDDTCDVLFVPDKETVIKNMADKILISILYKRIIEAALGTQAATLTAMRSAYDTACEYSEILETEMNRKRQGQVTADVLETASEFSMEGDV